jgi:flagellar hook-basal body complex protein FliE
MSPITPIRAAIAPIEAPSVRPPSPGNLFAEQLKTSMETVEGLGNQARQSAERFLNGEPEELHNVALASQQAALSMELFLQVRNKVVQAYQEVMRMQV